MENNIYEMYPFALGTSIRIEDVNDDIFAAKLAGDGMAVKPITGEIFAPCDGKIVMVNEKMYAITLENEQGIEVLIHVGLDTSKLQGEGFNNHYEVGDKVSMGDLLINYDREVIGTGGENDIVIMVIVEPKGYEFYNFQTGMEIVKGMPIINYKKRL